MFDVPLSAGRLKQRVLCSQLQHRRAGAVGPARDDILLDLCSAETLQKNRRRPGRQGILKRRHHLSARLLLLAVLVAPALAGPVYKAGDWIVINPPDEGFSVQLPAKPEEQTDRSTFESNTYKMRLYTSNDQASGLLYMVVMQEFPDLSGVLTPAVRFEKFMDGFKQGFAKSLADSAGMKVDVQFDRDLNLKGATIGRQYILSLGETRGLLRAFDANPRNYVLMVLGGDHKKAEVNRFFDSFEIKAAPPPIPQPLKTNLNS